MALLTRDKLLAKQKFQIEKVELDGENFVFVREMSGRGKDRFEQSLSKTVKVGKKTEYQSDPSDFRAKLAVATVCNKDGELIFQQGDYEALSESMTGNQLDKIVEVAQKLNRISETDKGEMVKN